MPDSTVWKFRAEVLVVLRVFDWGRLTLFCVCICCSET